MNCGRFVLGKKGGEKECHGEREAARLAEVFCHSADSHKLIQIQPSQLALVGLESTRAIGLIRGGGVGAELVAREFYLKNPTPGAAHAT